MNQDYKVYHPKWYRRRMPIFWWARRWPYTRFISRELTSLAVGYAAVLLIVQIWALSQGEQMYERFVELLQSPIALGVHFLVLIALLFHTVTWLNLAPSALVIRLGRKQLPDSVVRGAHYLAWIAVSVLVVWLLLGR